MPKLPNRYLAHLADLHELIASMEQFDDLDDLPKEERLIIYAIMSVAGENSRVFQISDVRNHRLCSGISYPTFYSHLSRILERGNIRLTEGRRAGEYVFVGGGGERSQHHA